ncbi:filaggrin-2-like isoform X1 [Cotesia glomerata]|nr:filaggrin-2-like isoform X1 [Cotesia glomerata]
MLKKLLIIFCAIVYGSAAPRCIDLCTPSLNAHTSESLTAFGTHSSLAQQQSTLRELHQSLTDQLQSSRLNVNFDHPGNWTDHKDYRTPDGAGQVHEEAGQLVNGGAQVRYYKKNYAATYGTGSNNLGLGHNLNSESLLQDDLLHSRNLGLQSVHNYGHDQSRLDSSRFQESTNTQLYNDRVNGASNDNWSRFNTYGVDGGRGKVSEEEGQYTQGPAKVRYYKKNYTSSYTSSGTPLVVPIITDVTNLESQAQRLESQLNQLSRDSQHSQSIHSDNSARQTEYGQVYTQNNYPQHYDRPLSTEQRYQHTSQQQQTVKTGGSGYIPVQPVTHFNYVIPDTELENVQTSQHTNQQAVQTQQTHRAEIDETHHNQQVGDIVRVPLHRNDYGSNVNTYIEDSRRQETLTAEQALRNQLRDNIQYAAVQDIPTHSGRRVEEHWESNSRHRVESTIPHHVETVPIGGDLTHQRISQGLGYSNQARHVSGGSSSSYQHHEQFGSSGSYRVGGIDLGHQAADCDTLGGQLGQYTKRHKRDIEFGQQRENIGGYPYSGYGRSHEGHPHQDNDRHRHHGDGFEQNSGIDNHYQNQERSYQDHRHHGQNFGQHSQDYGQHGQDYGQYNQERGNGHSGYGQSYEQQSHRDDNRHKHYGQDYTQRYRRDEYHRQDHDHKSHEGHPHQDDDRHRHLSRDNDFDKNGGHSHDHQSHEGNSHQDNDRHRHSEGEHRYKRESQRYEDFDQQTNAGFGDLSQQTTGEFDFGQNTEKLTLEKQNIENLNQEAQGVDFWHKQPKNLEFGQQTEDLSQHSFDFGQQTEDLSQQTHKFDDLSHHQSSGHEFDRHHKLETGNLEFGQQTEDLSQQTHNFDFGQQTEDLSQQTHKFDDLSHHQSSSGHELDRRYHKLETGNLEFEQQTKDLSQQTHKFDDLSDHQSSGHELDRRYHKLETGNLEFDQQTEDLSQQTHNFDFGQQTEDLSQQTHKFDDLSSHQSSGHEFDRRHHKLETGNLEFGQQTEDLSQQTHNFDFGQQTEDLSQQTHKFDDLSHHQSSSGHELDRRYHKLETGNSEFGQQTKDLSQQTHKFDDLSDHQSSGHELDSRYHKLETGNLEFDQQTEDLSQQTHNFDFGQQTEDLSQQTHKFDDLSSHQSSGHEFDRRHHKLETGNLEFGQQTEDLSQQTHNFDFGQQTEDLSQQTHKLDDLSHHESSSHEFDRRHHKLGTGNLEFGQQTEDLSQQSHKFDDFHLPLRPVGSHEFGQHHHELETGNLEFGQKTEDLSQQTHNLDDFSHHKFSIHEFDRHHHKLETGNLEFGQQTEDLSQQTHNFEFGHQTEDLSQQTHKLDDFNHHQSGTHEFGRHHKLETGNLEFGQQTEDLSQQTHKLDDFSQHHSENHEFAQHHNQLHTGNLEFGQQTEDLSQQTHKIGEFSQHQSGNHKLGQYDNQLQTGNLEFGQSNSEFGQQTGFNPSTNYPLEFKPAPKPTPRPLRIGNQRGDIEPELVGSEAPVSSVKPVISVRPVKGGRAYTPRVRPAQYQSDIPSTGVLSLEEQSLAQESGNSWHQSHHPGDLTNDNQEQLSQVDSVTLQSRILQVYGGKGPYEAGIQGDYSGVKPNPSATLEPQYYGNEPWEIREVASEKFSARSSAPLDTVPELTTPLPETTPSPGFWKKLGNKITTSYEKAKDKLSNTFG